MLTSAFAEHLVVQVDQEIPVQRLQLRQRLVGALKR
jgi:hypothetical protein